ncbi:MAG: Dabb family protein [Planctomycetota bacterium]
MFVHCVLFWLEVDVNEGTRNAFVKDLHGLADSPNVGRVTVLTPAGTPRDVVDSSYDYQLLIEFADKAAHDAYQSDADAVHSQFVGKYRDDWAKVVVYDGVPA